MLQKLRPFKKIRELEQKLSNLDSRLKEKSNELSSLDSRLKEKILSLETRLNQKSNEGEDALKSNLLEKLENRLKFYEDRFVMASKNVKVLEDELETQENRLDIEENLVRIRVSLERAKAKRDRIMGCWFELRWFYYLLNFGNSEKWLDFHFLEYADFEHMLSLAKESEKE